MTNKLAVVQISGIYYRDDRLKEYRNVKSIADIIPFMQADLYNIREISQYRPITDDWIAEYVKYYIEKLLEDLCSRPNIDVDKIAPISEAPELEEATQILITVCKKYMNPAL